MKKINMTKGPIMRNILVFALPIVISNILQYLYTTVDTLVVGKFCGAVALAAVGTSAQPVEVIQCIFLGIGGGVSILVAQHVGAGDGQAVKKLVKTATTFVYLCGIPLAIIGVLVTPMILRFMGTPEDAFDTAVIYTQIVFLGSLGTIGYNMNAGILKGYGDSNSSLNFLIISGVTNIILDLVFVASFKFDVAGAAAATSISIFISWVASIIYIRRRCPDIGLTILPKGIDTQYLKRIIGMGLPIGLNNSLYSIGHLAMQTYINSQGSVFMAGCSIASRVTGISNMAITALSSAAMTYSGQNYGARKYDRLREGYKKIPFISGAFTLIMGLLLIPVRMPILRLFTSEAGVLMYASRYVLIMLLCQWMYATFNTILNVINGVGLVKQSTVINLLMLWAVRIPGAYIINRFFDGTYVMLSVPVSFAFGMFCAIGVYIFSPKWHEIIRREEI